MQYEIQCQPSYSVLEVQLQPGEQVVTEAGAMVWMSDNLRRHHLDARGRLLRLEA